MAVHHLSAHVDLGALLGGLQRSLQRTIDLVSLGLLAVDTIAEGELSLPEAHFQVVPAQNVRRTIDSAKEEYKTWALCAGLRDCVEATSAFLEEVRTVCAVYSLKALAEVRGANWNLRMVSQRRKFHQYGLPKKLQHLQEQYGLAIDLFEELLSINSARNCLVHRGGVVSGRDTNDGDSLVVKWSKFQIVVHGKDGERVVVPPANIDAGEIVSIRESSASKTFNKGALIQFSAQEFSELALTFLLFGLRLVKKVEDYGQVCGVRRQESSA